MSEQVEELIRRECDDLLVFLIGKNRKYGNSALEPKRVFSKASAHEQLLVRIDDKLSRIATTGTKAPDEDTLLDLIGYLVLLRVAARRDRIGPRHFAPEFAEMEAVDPEE